MIKITTTAGEVQRIIECESASDAIQILTGIDTNGHKVQPRASARGIFKDSSPMDTPRKKSAAEPEEKAPLCEACRTTSLRKNSKACESCGKRVCTKCRSSKDRTLCRLCAELPE